MLGQTLQKNEAPLAIGERILPLPRLDNKNPYIPMIYGFGIIFGDLGIDKHGLMAEILTLALHM